MRYIGDPNDPCLALNGYEMEYHELTCLYPTLGKFYLPFEKTYEPLAVLQWMKASAWFPITACTLYAIFCWQGQVYFKNRDRWYWRNTLAAWNLFLSVFSFIGMCRVGPQLAHNLYSMTLEENLCGDPRNTYGSGSTGLWVQLFILSKFPELFDTFFIVIHKKPLIFLHWYHHITVLLYCWHSYTTTSPPGIFFVVMNYTVHSAMYFYYFLMAIRCKPKWLDPMYITAMQISQMIAGVILTGLGFYYYSKNPDCVITAENNTAAFIMYGSYLFLFLQFFLGRYFGPKKTKKKTA